MSQDLLAIAEAAIKRLEVSKGPAYALAAGRIAFGAQLVAGVTRMLAGHVPESQHERMEQLLQSLAHFMSGNASLEAMFVGADVTQLATDGLQIADDLDLGQKAPVGGLH
jgi:hypothetical protein